jgi:hypothetical protein
VRNATTTATINALKQKIFAAFLVPDVIVSDEEKCIVSAEFKRFCLSLGIQNVTTSSYYSQPSHAEMPNRNLHAALITYYSTSQRRCDEELPWLQVAFNMASHEATAMTPFEIIFSFRGTNPLTNRRQIQNFLPDKSSFRESRRRSDKVRRNLLHNRRSLEARYNPQRKPFPFKVGDFVWLSAHHVSCA